MLLRFHFDTIKIEILRFFFSFFREDRNLSERPSPVAHLSYVTLSHIRRTILVYFIPFRKYFENLEIIALSYVDNHTYIKLITWHFCEIWHTITFQYFSVLEVTIEYFDEFLNYSWNFWLLGNRSHPQLCLFIHRSLNMVFFNF